MRLYSLIHLMFFLFILCSFQAAPAAAQLLAERFDDITTLPGAGWVISNQSSPIGTSGWFQGNDNVFPAQAGDSTSYIAANYNSTADVGTISNWLITPPLVLRGDSKISFWTRTDTGSTWPDRLEVRLSTNGTSDNTGSTATDIGDFTTLLLTINPTLTEGGYPEVWTRYEVAINATGTSRIAFRYFVTNGGPPAINSNYIGIDTVEVINRDVLIIQDQLPWGYNAIQDILTANNISYHQITSAQMDAIDLSRYEMVIIPSLQTYAFYTTWNTNINQVESYVSKGGRLWQSTCNFGLLPLATPGGVVSGIDEDQYNLITDPSHLWVQGVPSPMFGSMASHQSFTNLYSGSKIVATAQTSGRPVLVDYRYGAGRVLLTGQTLEYAWWNNWDGKPILENSLMELFDWKKPFFWPMFLPAIIINAQQ
ncbi:MAG: choice-of-anchor J domain-containing protein [Desulfobulbaceae bacterium]|nr:choice-of-anchor J domain-containing protein [Desulfobulbaceae bacterium]